MCELGILCRMNRKYHQPALVLLLCAISAENGRPPSVQRSTAPQDDSKQLPRRLLEPPRPVSHQLAYLFQRSLEGDTLEWYYTLPIHDVQDFSRVRDCFFEKYSHRVGYVPSLTDLIIEKIRPDEDFT